jgi:hypothetical protein
MFQLSDCNTYRIMCYVPSIAVLKDFLVWLVNYSLKPYYHSGGSNYYWYNPAFHVPHSLYKLLYFRLFSASFCVIFLSAGITTYIGRHVFSFITIIICGLSAVTSLCMYPLTIQHCHIFMLINWLWCVCLCLPFVCRFVAECFAYSVT